MSSSKSDINEYPPDWPPGVTIENLCWQGCEYCQRLRNYLYDYRDGLSADGAHKRLSAFTDQPEPEVEAD